MASIIDAVEESFQDQHSIIKFILYAIPVFILTNYNKETIPEFNLWVIATSILMFGFSLVCTYNVRTGKNRVLPDFNFVAVFWAGLKGGIALLPIAFVSGFIAQKISEILPNYIPESTLLTIMVYVIYAICASFVYTGYLLYANRFKILDAYNLKAISTYCIDIMIAIFFMAIQIFILDLLIVLPISYIIWVFFGIPHPVAIFFWSAVGVFNLAVQGHYLAQISYEIIEIKEKKAKNE